MSRSRQRWEEPAESHWEPVYGHPYSDEYRGSRRGYAPPTDFLPRSFNYWRDEPVPPTSYYPQRSYRQEYHGDQWGDSSRPWHTESSHSRRRRDFGSGRNWDDSESWRDSSPSPRSNSPGQRRPTHTPQPYVPPSTLPASSPIERTLPPSLQQMPPEPSPGYLSISKQLSEVLRDPGSSRKLLVLDLNGTLLIRSARSRFASGPQLRRVQPRPYMQSFRQYLFCPETKAWLETMIWSSAQPHSVDDMVDKVFGASKGELKAVWNRKSLGLSEADYHRKAITTKDLTKPWGLLAWHPGVAMNEGHSAVTPQSQIIHSPLTTLLLDDSPHKAALQPYNHVCIPEYDNTRRQQDLRSFFAARVPKNGKKDMQAKRKVEAEAFPCSSHRIIPDPSPTVAKPLSDEDDLYDVTLLSVIGILEAVKYQSNVAGWIRDGGLWVTRERFSEAGALHVNRRWVDKAEGGEIASSTIVGTRVDASGTSDPAVTPEQIHLQTKMWFDDPLVVAYWVAQGRRTLMELGIHVVHGVTG